MSVFRITAMNPDTEFDDGPIADWNEALQQFLADYPDSTLLRAFSGTAQDQLEQIRAQLEPGAEAFTHAQRQVRDGALPYGVLSARARKTLTEALVRRGAGVVPLGASVASLESETPTASAVIGMGSVVVDLSTIAVLAVVPRLWDTLISQFSSVYLTPESLDDLMMASDAVALRSTGTFGFDPRSGTVVLSETAIESETLVHDRVTWMLERARSLRIRPVAENPRPDDDLGDDALGWLSTIDLTVELGVSMLADDPVMRRLARAAGATSFGSIAVFQAMADSSVITQDAFDETILDLARNYCVDLPISWSNIVILAAEDNYEPGPATAAVARGSAWTDTNAIPVRFDAVAGGAIGAGRARLPMWIAACALGFGRRSAGALNLQDVSSFLTWAARRVQATPDEMEVVESIMSAELS